MKTALPTPSATVMTHVSMTSPHPTPSMIAPLHVIIDHAVGIPTWLQVLLGFLGIATSVTLVIVTIRYVRHTAAMAAQMRTDAAVRQRQLEREADERLKEIERQAQERRMDMSRDAAGRLSSAFWTAVQSADDGEWAYGRLARPLQRNVSEYTARLLNKEVQQRVLIAVEVLGHAYPDPKISGEHPPQAYRDKVIPVLKHLGDVLTAYQLDEPIPASILPPKEEARQWVRGVA